MKAFVEIASGFIRIGPDAEGYGSDWEIAAGFIGDGRRAIVKALSNPDSKTRPCTLADHRAGTRALEDLGFTEVVWSHKQKEQVMANENAKANPGSKAHKPDQAFGPDPNAFLINPDGSVNWANAEAAMAATKADEQAGNLKIVHFSYSDHGGERVFTMHGRAV